MNWSYSRILYKLHKSHFWGIFMNTGVVSLSLLQGIFPTQGLNSGLPHCRQILSQLSHKGRPRILKWVAYPFSRGSSWPRNQTGVSCLAGRFFTNWAIREAHKSHFWGIFMIWKCAHDKRRGANHQWVCIIGFKFFNIVCMFLNVYYWGNVFETQ